MLMDNLMEYSNYYLKTSGSLCQYCRDEPTFINAVVINVCSGNFFSFKFKQKLTGQTEANDRKDIEIMPLSKYLSNF